MASSFFGWAINVSVLLITCILVEARLPDGRMHANQPPIPVIPKLQQKIQTKVVTDVNGVALPPYQTIYYFDQLIDHKNPGKGTFKQRYWTTWEFYKPGGPIIMLTPGEANADGYWPYLTNKTLPGMIAQQEGGATIVYEHRFYGLSNPYPDLSVQSFSVHTLEQAIEDADYFARNVKLPMPGGDAVGPENNPWIFVGGSYSGALASWLKVTKPDTFYAAYGSSAVVQAIDDLWQYFEPVRQHMPANCSADAQRVITHIDTVFGGNNQTAINEIKTLFGVEEIEHLDDIAGALRNNFWDWQRLQPDSGPNANFFRFCNALEVKDGVSAPASGWGLEHALAVWGYYFHWNVLLPVCWGVEILECLNTYDPTYPHWTDTSIDNAWRSWFWTVCTEVGWYQTGAPEGTPTLISRLVKPIYEQRQCQYMFPGAFANPPTPDTSATNTKYHGWNVNAERLFFANGNRDPWRDATMSAQGQNIPSTPQQPIAVSNGFHCTDLSAAYGTADPSVKAVQNQALASFKTWLQAWPAHKQNLRR